MKRYKITLLITFVVLALMLIQTGTSAAYQLGWKGIQHRVYESGSTINRFAFEILDDSGDYVANASVVTGVVLKNPSGTPVNLTTIKFTPLFDYYGSRFNTTNSA